MEIRKGFICFQKVREKSNSDDSSSKKKPKTPQEVKKIRHSNSFGDYSFTGSQDSNASEANKKYSTASQSNSVQDYRTTVVHEDRDEDWKDIISFEQTKKKKEVTIGMSVIMNTGKDQDWEIIEEEGEQEYEEREETGKEQVTALDRTTVIHYDKDAEQTKSTDLVPQSRVAAGQRVMYRSSVPIEEESRLKFNDGTFGASKLHKIQRSDRHNVGEMSQGSQQKLNLKKSMWTFQSSWVNDKKILVGFGLAILALLAAAIVILPLDLC